MTSIPPLSKSIGWVRGVTEGRADLLDLQRQLATGKKADSYGTLGPERTLSIAMRARISQIATYNSTIQTVSLRMEVMAQSLTRFGEIGREVKTDAMLPTYDLAGGNQSSLQLRSTAALDEALALLRADVAGRYVFSGRSVDQDPIPSLDAILDGEGAKAGFRQHLDERRQADLGADGLGRLVIDPPMADTVTIAEDAAGSPFGFKLTSLSSDIAGATVTAPTGTPPAASIAFAGATPEPGDTVRLRLQMPDGTETTIELTVAEPGEAGPSSFEVGADANETAANFQSALEGSVSEAASVELAAASGFAAADDFFNFDADNPPQRVDGPPFDSAAALRDATEADTVFWYRGDAAAGDARATSVAQIDDSISVAYGARANEEALRWTIQNLAVLAAETYSSDVATDEGRHGEMTSRVSSNLAHPDGRPDPTSIHSQIVAAQGAMGAAGERHEALSVMAEGMLADTEGVDHFEVAAQILQTQTRLTASYQVTAMLSQLSLVYSMR